MLRKTCGLAVSLALLAGCENTEEPAENVNSPSEGAQIENQNPTTPTVDVPGTPENEAAEANADMPAPAAERMHRTGRHNRSRPTRPPPRVITTTARSSFRPPPTPREPPATTPARRPWKMPTPRSRPAVTRHPRNNPQRLQARITHSGTGSETLEGSGPVPMSFSPRNRL